MKKITLFTVILMISNMMSAQWIQIQNPYPNNNDTLREIYFIDQDHGFLGGSYWEEGNLMGSIDAGNNWTYELWWVFLYPISISFSDQNNGWLISNNYYEFSNIWHTTDGGFNLDSWEMLETTEFWGVESIYFTDSLNGWICGGGLGMCGDTRSIYSTIDGGLSWNEYMGMGGKLSDIFFLNDSTGWTVGRYSNVLYTNDKGDTWHHSCIEPLGQKLRAVQFIDENNGCVVGESTNGTGIIFKSYDGGINWELKLGDTIPPLNDLKFTDELNGWAVGYSGTILHTSDGGETWEYQESGTSSVLKKVCFVDVNNGWICGLSGTILHTDNGGITGLEAQIRSLKYEVRSYPNPVSENCMIEFDLDKPTRVSIQVYNSMGELLIEPKYQIISTGQHQVNLNLIGLKEGIYFCRVQLGSEVIVEKIVKK